MLYLSTQSDRNVFTAHKTLCSDYASDGGYYVPFRFPVYSASELASMRELSFNEIVANIINLFFSARLTVWDVDFCIGRNVCRIFTMNHRIAVAELWHNPGSAYSYVVEKIYNKICKSDECLKYPTNWARIAIGIAVQFAVYIEMLRAGVLEDGQVYDVSVEIEDFTNLIASFYAKKMGLPIDTFICIQKGSGSVWDLIQRGIYSISENDVTVAAGVERLIYCTLGMEQAIHFSRLAQSGRTYTIDEDSIPQFNSSLFCSVAGAGRADTIINSIYRSNSYIIDPSAAICYGGVQDFRAKIGDSRLTLILSQDAPVNTGSQIKVSTGLTDDTCRSATN